MSHQTLTHRTSCKPPRIPRRHGRCGVLRHTTGYKCDRTPLNKQGFVSQDPTGGFSTKRECANTHISIQYHDIQVIKQLLHIKCHVLWFTKDKAQKMLQQIFQCFHGSNVSHDKHTLFTLEESGPPRSTYTYESQYGTQPSSVWISHWKPSSASQEERGRSSPAHRWNKITKSKSLSDYAQQDLSVVTQRPWILDMQMLQVK
jgi:hypothetical protein